MKRVALHASTHNMVAPPRPYPQNTEARTQLINSVNRRCATVRCIHNLECFRLFSEFAISGKENRRVDSAFTAQRIGGGNAGRCVAMGFCSDFGVSVHSLVCCERRINIWKIKHTNCKLKLLKLFPFHFQLFSTTVFLFVVLFAETKEIWSTKVEPFEGKYQPLLRTRSPTSSGSPTGIQ